MSDDDTLLDISEAARFLNVSETSLRRWTNDGRLACLRVGRRRERRFRRADLLAFMEHQPVERARRDAGTAATTHAVIDRLEVPHGMHLCGLYGSVADRVRLALAFLADGIGPRSACYVVGSLAFQSGIRSRLERSRGPLATDIGEGRLVFTEHASTTDSQCEFFEKRFTAAMKAGVVSLRVVGDMWSFVKNKPVSDLIDLESGFSELIAPRYPVVALCQYDVRRFSGVDVLAALKGHPDTFHYPADRVLA